MNYLKRVTKFIVERLLRRFPQSMHRFIDYLLRQKLALSVAELKKRGLNFGVVYDIGANQGNWTRQMRQQLPDAEFFLFEANPKNEGSLKSTGEKFFISVLSSTEKLVDFYDIGGTGDSYYLEQTPHYKEAKPLKLTTVTLDKMVETKALPYPDFIKIDTQGSEIDILRGGEKVLGNCSLVLLECPMIEYNLGAPNIFEYISYMTGQGFVVIDICELHYSEQTLLQVDLLFLNKNAYKKIRTQ